MKKMLNFLHAKWQVLRRPWRAIILFWAGVPVFGFLLWVVPGYIWGIFLMLVIVSLLALAITNFIYEVFDE